MTDVPLPPRVIRALESLNIDDSYEPAPSNDAVYLYILSASNRHGVHQPFDAEAAALNDWLIKARANKRLVDEAWAAFINAGAVKPVKNRRQAGH
jgi:hypothetical protein